MRIDPLQSAFNKALGTEANPCTKCGGQRAGAPKGTLTIWQWDAPKRCESCGALLDDNGVPISSGRPGGKLRLIIMGPRGESAERLKASRLRYTEFMRLPLEERNSLWSEPAEASTN